MDDQAKEKPTTEPAVESGGPPCAEAQADGVPCEELDRDCEDCEHAEGAEAPSAENAVAADR